MLLQVVRALARRWYIVLVGLLLTAGLVFAAYDNTPPKYSARGLVLLLPSHDAVGAGGNPFLMLSGLEQAAGVVVAYFSSSSAESEILSISPTAEYQVAIDDATRGPVIAVDVISSSPEETLGTLQHIVGRIPQELTRLQKQVGVPANAEINSMELTVDGKATTDRGAMMRTMIAALMGGLGSTCLAAVLIDSKTQQTKSRRRRQGSSRSVEDSEWSGKPVEEHVRNPERSGQAEGQPIARRTPHGAT